MAYDPIHDGIHYSLEFFGGNMHAWQDFKDKRAREKTAKAKLQANRKAKVAGKPLPYPGPNGGARGIGGAAADPAGGNMTGSLNRAVPGFLQPSHVLPAIGQQRISQQPSGGGIQPVHMPQNPPSHYQQPSQSSQTAQYQVGQEIVQPNYGILGQQNIPQTPAGGGTNQHKHGQLSQNYPQYAPQAFASARQSTVTGYPSSIIPHLSMPKGPSGAAHPSPVSLNMPSLNGTTSSHLGANTPVPPASTILPSNNGRVPQVHGSQQLVGSQRSSTVLTPPSTYYQTSKSQTRHGVSSSQQQQERKLKQEQQGQRSNEKQRQASQPQGQEAQHKVQYSTPGSQPTNGQAPESRNKSVGNAQGTMRSQSRIEGEVIFNVSGSKSSPTLRSQKEESNVFGSKPPLIIRSTTELEENRSVTGDGSKPSIVRRSQTKPQGYIGLSGSEPPTLVLRSQTNNSGIPSSRPLIPQAHTAAQQHSIQTGIPGSVSPRGNQTMPDLRPTTERQAQRIEATIPGSAAEAIVEKMNEIRKTASKKSIPGNRYVPIQQVQSIPGMTPAGAIKTLTADSSVGKNKRSNVEGTLPSSAAVSVVDPLKGIGQAASHKSTPGIKYTQSIPDIPRQEVGRVPTKDARVENDIRSMVEAIVPSSKAPSIFQQKSEILVQSIPDWTQQPSERRTASDNRIGDNVRTFVEAMIPESQVPEELQIQPLVQSVPDWTPPGSVHKVSTKDARIGENNRSYIEAMIPGSEADSMFRNQPEYQRAVTAPVLVQSVKDMTRPASMGRVRTAMAKIGDTGRTFVEAMVSSKGGREIEKQKGGGGFGGKQRLGAGGEKKKKRLGEK